jgi:membrane peptidoglycan carboxypeptidase
VIGGILRAAKDMVFHRGLQGGSTITQQLVKSALLTQERTVQRKLKEIVLAIWTEQLYSKNEILEMYDPRNKNL